jgi:hypothetical protein
VVLSNRSTVHVGRVMVAPGGSRFQTANGGVIAALQTMDGDLGLGSGSSENITYSVSPPASPDEGDVWIEKGI